MTTLRIFDVGRDVTLNPFSSDAPLLATYDCNAGQLDPRRREQSNARWELSSDPVEAVD